MILGLLPPPIQLSKLGVDTGMSDAGEGPCLNPHWADEWLPGCWWRCSNTSFGPHGVLTYLLGSIFRVASNHLQGRFQLGEACSVSPMSSYFQHLDVVCVHWRTFMETKGGHGPPSPWKFSLLFINIWAIFQLKVCQKPIFAPPAHFAPPNIQAQGPPLRGCGGQHSIRSKHRVCSC